MLKVLTSEDKWLASGDNCEMDY